MHDYIHVNVMHLYVDVKINVEDLKSGKIE